MSAPTLYDEGWPEEMHAALAEFSASIPLALLGLTSLMTALGQDDPVTAALDIMRTRNEFITPAVLREVIEEFDTRS